ncbi:MAG: response regulator [Phycisphaerales bacterium]|nr:response regulator [Phycisphaerales bacterium]
MNFSTDLVHSILSRTVATEARSTALMAHCDPEISKLCRSVLEQNGWDVHESPDGFAVIQHCQRDCPDIVLLDMELPKLSGLETTKKLRSSPITEDIPILVLGKEGDDSGASASLEAGADIYLRKPITAEEFALQVRSLSRLQRTCHKLQKGRSSLGEQARALSLLLDFSAALSKMDNLDAILNKMISVTAEMTSCRRVSIMLPDATGQYLNIAASTGIENYVKENVRLGVGESIAGRVFIAGSPILLNNQDDADRELETRDHRLFDDLPLLSTPMCASENVVGVLNLTDRVESKPFDTLELGYLSLFTNYAAAAIQNARTREARDQARDSIVIAMAKLAEHRDDDTGKHLDRVTLYCIKLATELRGNPLYASQINAKFLQNLERAAPLHDIGKVAIPDSILLKPDKLTDSEMAIMQTHSRIGAETIRSVLDKSPDSGFLKMAEEIAHSHHEWYNGSGYPQGLEGENIPLAARILALADVYDALTTKRVYKNAFSHRKSVEIILKESGTHFDPDVVKAFMRLETEFERLAKELADDPPLSPADPGMEKYIPREMQLSPIERTLSQISLS